MDLMNIFSYSLHLLKVNEGMCGKLWVILDESQLSNFQTSWQRSIAPMNLPASGLQFYTSRKAVFICASAFIWLMETDLCS